MSKRKHAGRPKKRWYEKPQVLAVISGFLSALVSTIQVLLVAFK